MRIKMEYFLCMGKLYKVSRFGFFHTSCCYHPFFQQKNYFSFWFFLVSKSCGQNTKQDTLLCARVRSQMKNQIFFPFPFSKLFSPPQIRHNRNQIQHQQILTENQKATIMYNAPHGVTKKSCLHVVDLLFQRCY